MGELAFHLNRLAGSEGLDAQGAANFWLGTTQIDLVRAINLLAHTNNLELNGALKVLAGVFGGNPNLDMADALDTAIKFILYPLLDLFPDLTLYPGVA